MKEKIIEEIDYPNVLNNITTDKRENFSTAASVVWINYNYELSLYEFIYKYKSDALESLLNNIKTIKNKRKENANIVDHIVIFLYASQLNFFCYRKSSIESS